MIRYWYSEKQAAWYRHRPNLLMKNYAKIDGKEVLYTEMTFSDHPPIHYDDFEYLGSGSWSIAIGFW